MPTQRKAETIGGLSELLKQSTMVILTEYRGMTVAEITDLRNKLRPSGSEYHVTKNTLMLRAANSLNYNGLDEVLSGPTAVTFVGKDLVPAIKAVQDYAKGSKVFVIKGGILGGKIIKTEQLDDIAKLPSREEMISKMLGSIKSPTSRLVNTLAAPPRNLVTVLAAPTRNLVNVLEQRRLQLEQAGTAS
jgi:large subunit ribosomal protein L10